jgi:hypothetical protein
MTSISASGTSLFPAARRLPYWLLIFPFGLIFVGSVVLNIFDVSGGEVDYVDLGFPAWLVWWATVAKVLGLAAIVWGRSRILTIAAYAGFVYDLLLAVTAHIYHQPIYLDRLILAIATLVFAAVAIWAEHRYNFLSK